MAKTPDEQAAAMVANLRDKTGKTLKEWLKIVTQANLDKHGVIVNMLKSQHGVTHGYASLIAQEFLNGDSSNSPNLVDAQYSGHKSKLRDIYGALIQAVQRFGNDVEIAPKKSYVSLRRKKQFAIIQPSTRTRVDVGIKCRNVAPTDRFEPSGSFNSMVSHRVRITSKNQIDDELVEWLKQAYDNA